jgi:signal transduction histidine kinase
MGRFNDFYEDAIGTMWVARSRGPLHSGGICKLDDSALKCFGSSEHQLCDFGDAIAQDDSGDFWIGSADGACRWHPAAGNFFGQRIGTPENFGVAAFLAEPDGSMLVGFYQSGQHLGLQQMTALGTQPFSAGGFNGEDVHVACLLRDRDGALWIGTSNEGIYHVNRGKVDRFTTADGLSSNTVNALLEDREGNVWVATSGGIDRLHQRPVSAITTREGLAVDRASSVLALADGSVLIGTLDGLDILRDGTIDHVRADRGLPGHAITSMLDDQTGKVWVGVDDSLALYDGKTFHTILKPDGSKLGVVVGLAKDDRRDIWALTTGRPYRLSRIHNGKYLDEIHLPGGQGPYSIETGPDGSMVILTRGPKLFFYKTGKFRSISAPGAPDEFHHISVLSNGDIFLFGRQGAYYLSRGRSLTLDKASGLPCEDLSCVTDASQSTLWLRGQCGIMIVKKSDLSSVLDHPREALVVRLLDGTDGAQPGAPSFEPAVAKSANGRLWFATDGVLLTADPAHLLTNTLPPPVHVEGAIADHQVYAVAQTISLPAMTRDVEIDYAALSLIAPQKMQFRYRLTGLDDIWQNVGNRRAAFYMNLKPGQYRFQVIASNNDGVWNTFGDDLNFSIEPAFYQTSWFQVLAGAALCTLLWILYSLRLRQISTRMRARLEERVSERERIARELHDTLLQGFQGLVMRFQAATQQIHISHPARHQMESALDAADEILDEGRKRVFNLRTQASFNIPDTLASAGRRLLTGSKANFRVVVEGRARTVHPVVQEEIVRIGEEALRNAVKHGRPDTLEVLIAYHSHEMGVVFRDNGIGIDPEVLADGGRKYHFGMTGMRERALKLHGKLVIKSRLGAGTEIILSVPSSVAYVKTLGLRSLFMRHNRLFEG